MTSGGVFEVGKLKDEIKMLESEVSKEDFWNDLEKANKTYQQLSNIKKKVKSHADLQVEIELSTQLLELDDIKLEDVEKLEERINQLEINTLFTGLYDSNACYLEIHPGAGGTESCDWASMLMRMYERFFTKCGYKYKIVDKQDGDEAGIKSVTFYVEGDYAYGILKNEKGVHRLVRISPFDSNKRRHTSFASVSVTPEFNKDIDIQIREEDLKIDVYHSSGAGGQSVNTANSAVRITHLPTKIVVTCQNERSQLRNKEIALNILKNKLYEKELEKQENELKTITGEVTNIDFGSQIRNYVLEPYKLVKDVRSKFESNEPDKILDGDLKPIILSVLRDKNK